MNANFQMALKMYRNKNEMTGAIKYTIKRSITCLREQKDETKKEADLTSIFQIFASVFHKLGLPGPVFHKLGLRGLLLGVLEFMVDWLLDKKEFDEVLELCNSSYPATLRVPFRELQMRANYEARATEAFWVAAGVWDVDEILTYAKTAYIYGTMCLETGTATAETLEKAINILTFGLQLAESEEEKKKMQDMLTEVNSRMEAALGNHQQAEHVADVAERHGPEVFQQAAQEVFQVAQDDPQQAQHLADRIANELLADENARLTADLKRKAKKQLSNVKKAVELTVLEENKAEGSGSNSVEEREQPEVLEENKAEGSGSISVEEIVQPEFEQQTEQHTISVTMVHLDGKSFLGSTIINNIARVEKSFIVAESAQIDNIQELVCLALTHDNLLKIDQGFKTSEGSYMLLSSEQVCSLEHFFRQKLNENAPLSLESWWKTIKDIFWKVFRGLIRGLMHLFVRGKSCGDLVFNVFVTSKGEGRMIPSMKEANQLREVEGLVDLMQTVIKLPFPDQNDLSFLPHHLTHFFQLINTDRPVPLLLVPIQSLIDHPYFWNVAEKIDFTFKLRNLLKQKFGIIFSEAEQSYLSPYEDWWDNLDDVYLSIYEAAMRRRGTRVKRNPYKKSLDIVRYFGAVYTHINEYEYKVARNGKRFTDEKVESDLTRFFPNFYVDMYYMVYFCVHNGPLDYASLKGVSPVLSHEVPEEVIAEVPEEVIGS